MASRLFDRRVRVVLHTLEVTDLRIAFHASRSLRKNPNTCEIRIWNLNADHQRELQDQKSIPLRLEAGYAAPPTGAPLSDAAAAALDAIGVSSTPGLQLPVLFNGELRRAFTSREGGDLVTTISSGDGEKKGQEQRIKVSYRPGLRWRKLLTDLAKSAGVGIGNALSAVGDLSSLEISTGISMSGSSLDQLDNLMASQGFEMSVQNGELQVLGGGAALSGTAVELSEATGLVDAPEPGSDGKIKVRALLQPGLEPGRLVKLVSERVNGTFRVEQWDAIGDTHGQDWYAELEVGEVLPTAPSLLGALGL